MDIPLGAWPIGNLLLSYLSGEVVFFIVFFQVLLPRCNRLTEPQEYRDYGRDRLGLMVRILRRMERTCQATGSPFLPAFASFLQDWFLHDHVPGQPLKGAEPKFHPPGSSQEERNANRDEYMVPSSDPDCALPRKDDVNLLFSWGFFGKDYCELDTWMRQELEDMYSILRTNHGIDFEPGRTSGVQPMRLSLDPILPSYRPLGVYLGFSGLQFLGNLFLRACGFRRYTTHSGLRYWFRSQRRMLGRAPPANSPKEDLLLPMIFFHGIAPGGITLYLPMLMWGFGRDGRALYVFENPPISFKICSRIFNEAETVDGVQEAVSRHHGPDAIVSLLAHSFGSCQATWLLNSSLSHRIRQVTLIDPVSILLSEPDVMTNFLYQRHAYKERKGFNKIGVVANEIFIEHYLRRHFAWYNSELWLDDIPSETKVTICIAGGDEILNAAKIKREVEIYCDDIGGSMKGGLKSTSRMELIVWDAAGHGHGVSSPNAWKQTRSAMRKQEQLILQEESLTRLLKQEQLFLKEESLKDR